MFKRKPTPEQQAISLVQSYANKLGIERRLSVRVRFPTQFLTSLPSVFYGPNAVTVHDLSVGGCCLLDDADHMGPNAGNDIELRMIWPASEKTVRARIVSRVHNRRHIQFLDISPDIVASIRAAIAPGVLGITVTPLIDRPPGGIPIYAREVWTSLNGECLSLLDDIHVAAELHLDGRDYKFLRNAWPVKADGQPASPLEVENILIFIENISRPSAALKELKAQLQTIYFEGHS